MNCRPGRMPLLTLTAVLLVGGCTADSTPKPRSSSSNAPPPAAAGSVPDVVARVEPSVVTIVTGTGGLGSGVVYRAEGLIVTNAHVVGDEQRVRVAFADGSQVAGAVVGADDLSDLAVVRVERTGLPAARFQPTLPRPGELALAMGSPLGLENSVTQGIISGLGRQLPASTGGQGGTTMVDLIQTDAPISPGNSGGALVNAAGEIVGLNESYIPPQAGAVSLGFAIPAATVIDVADQIIATGKVVHPYLGVSVTDLTPEIASALRVGVDAGALVQRVSTGGPADAAGIRAGDVVVGFNGTKITKVADLLSAARRTKPGDRVRVDVRTGGNGRTVEVTMGTLGQR